MTYNIKQNRYIKELKLIKKQKCGWNNFYYYFITKEGKKYKWNTNSDYNFDKNEWWKVNFYFAYDDEDNIHFLFDEDDCKVIKGCHIRGNRKIAQYV